jgi:ribosomal protein S14
MKKQIKKNINQRYLFKNYELKRLILKAVNQNLKIQQKIRWKLQLQVFKIPFNSSVTRIKNRCILTGRSRSVYRFMQLSRIQLRKWASNGFLTGITKKSW